MSRRADRLDRKATVEKRDAMRDEMNSARQRFEHPLEPVTRALDECNIGKRTPELQASLDALDKAVRPRGRVPMEGAYVAVQTAPAPAVTVLETLKNDSERMYRVLLGTPTLGLVRMEWHNAVTGLVIPCNWSNSTSTPMGFLVDDAQNLLVDQMLRDGFTWLLLLEDDVVPPPDLFLRFAPYLDQDEEPIVSGLYHLKGSNEPLIYRGRGNGAFRKFTPGEQIRVDGIPTGCCLIHRKVLEVLHAAADVYTLRANGQVHTLKRVFQTPRSAFTDAGTGGYQKIIGTSDLYFCDQVRSKGVLTKAGWPQLQKLRYPFLCDTAIRCGHIDRNTGVIY